MITASIGIAAHMGWVASAVVALGGPKPRILRTDRIETADPTDREALEPYHVAGGFDGLARVPIPDDPGMVVDRGLQKQRSSTLNNLQALFATLADASIQIKYAGVLTGRGKAAPTLVKALGSHTQIHISEGLAVRACVTQCLESLGVVVKPIDQKTLFDAAYETLQCTEAEIMKTLSGLTPEVEGSWRKEDKLAAVAAWISLRSGRDKEKVKRFGPAAIKCLE